MKQNSIFTKIEEDSQKNWISFSFVISSLVVQIISLTFGAELFWMTDWKTFLLAVVLGDLILSVFLCISGYIGYSMRIPTAAQYGNIFGRIGAKIMNIVLLPAGIIWVAWMSDIAASTVHDVFPVIPGWTVVLVIVALSVFSAIRGVKGMEQSGYIQAPIVLILVLIGVISICIKGFGNGSIVLQTNQGTHVSLLEGVTFVVLTWISLLPIFSDYTRYVRTPKDMGIATFLSYGLLYTVMLIAGGVFAMACGPEYSLVRAFGAAGIPQWLVLVVVLLCTWTFNDRSFYSFGIAAGIIVGEKVKEWIPLVLGGLLAAGIALCGIVDQIYPVLNFIGSIFAPLFGIYLCRYYLLGGIKNCTSNFSGMIRFDWLPFVPWAVGSSLGLLLQKGQTAISFAVGFILYYIMFQCRKAIQIKKTSGGNQSCMD